VAGPVGTAIGGAIGAVAGGLAGKAAAEQIDPTAEDAYWREHHARQSYADPQYGYEAYGGAYRLGYEGYGRYGTSGRSWDELEPEFRRDYERTPGQRLSWDRARHATRAAWERLKARAQRSGSEHVSSTTGERIAPRNLENYVGYDVVDRNGNKVGALECLWSDPSGEPEYIGVRTGWLFGKTHVVPADRVEVSEGGRRLRLPYDEQTVKDAPSYDSDAEMNGTIEDEVRRHYGVTTRTQAPPQIPAQAPNVATTDRPTPEMATIQLSEEQLKIGKREVEAGGVRLRKVVRTEIVNQPVEVRREELVIERVPAEEAHTGRQQAFNEQEVYIPLRREEVVVQKETRLREEVRARKSHKTDRQEIQEEVRREDIEIEEAGEARTRSPRQGGPAADIKEAEEKPRSMRRHGE
jgi:uncharacterized protein (TIGR02271 family)